MLSLVAYARCYVLLCATLSRSNDLQPKSNISNFQSLKCQGYRGQALSQPALVMEKMMYVKYASCALYLLQETTDNLPLDHFGLKKNRVVFFSLGTEEMLFLSTTCSRSSAVISYKVSYIKYNAKAQCLLMLLSPN